MRTSDSTTTARVVSCSASDHDLITVSVPVTRDRRRPAVVTVRSTRRLNVDALCHDLLTADWSSVYTSDTVGEKWDAWLSVWSPCIDHHMPPVQIKTRHRPCPWLDDERVRDTMRERDEARAECVRNPCSDTGERYRACRNATKRAQYGARAAFFETSYRHSRSITWRDIRRFMISSNKTKPAPPPTEQATALADRLNPHFATVGQSVAAAAAARLVNSEYR